MFYTPTIPADLAPEHAPIECYSDFHKEAFGCRPIKAQPEDPAARAVELATLSAWMAEDERISAMAQEVARFRLSRTMEYLVRRGDAANAREAFRQIVEREDSFAFQGMTDWDSVCFDLGLPYSDAPRLKAFWEGQE